MNYIIQDLGFGDSGKGATVDYLCSREQIDLVVRFNGGFQAAHNVVLADGRHHCFSQFGSGTLRKVPTFLDRHVIVEPMSLRTEARHLSSLGVADPIGLITIHPDCLVSTMYHQILNRIQDGQSGHGSCGVGIGAVRSMWSKTGDGLTWGDLHSKRIIRRKLDWIRQWCQDQLVDYGNPEKRSDINIDVDGCILNALDEVELLYHSAYGVAISDYMNVDRNASVVFEGAQGYGLDEVFGTIPHTTYSNTRPTYALELSEHYLDSRPKIYGLIRAYETRHGNGPMWKEFPTCIRLRGEHNDGGFAGRFRLGHLNVEAIHRAYKHCGCDAMVINCMDHVSDNLRAKLILEFDPEIVSYGPRAEDRKRLR